MKRSYSADINKEMDSKEVKVAGWIDEKRDLGKISFIRLRDEKGYVQVILKATEIKDKLKDVKKETVVSVVGTVKANKTAPHGFEIVPKQIDILANAEPLPIDIHKKENTTLDKRFDNRILDLRTPENHNIFRIESEIVKGFVDYLNKKDFTQIFTPCLLGVASESGSEVFEIGFYDGKAFLRQDPQLHRQLTIAGGFEKIYDIGPCWRAEASHTTQHICEHRVCAVEQAFIENEYDVIKLEKEMVIHALNYLKKNCGDLLEQMNIEINIPEDIPVLEFPKIYEILESLGKKIPYGEEYDREGQKMLADYVKEKYGSDFFFVNKFPFAIKPFYVMTDGEFARSTDLLFKGIELSSGGQREHRHDVIVKQAKEKGMKEENVKWFSEPFRYGVPPHGGFAIGVERLVMALLNVKNIRETALFPRAPDRLVP